MFLYGEERWAQAKLTWQDKRRMYCRFCFDRSRTCLGSEQWPRRNRSLSRSCGMHLRYCICLSQSTDGRQSVSIKFWNLYSWMSERRPTNVQTRNVLVTSSSYVPYGRLHYVCRGPGRRGQSRASTGRLWLSGTVLRILITCPAYHRLQLKHFRIYMHKIPLHIMFLVGDEPLLVINIILNFLRDVNILHLISYHSYILHCI